MSAFSISQRYCMLLYCVCTLLVLWTQAFTTIESFFIHCYGANQKQSLSKAGLGWFRYSKWTATDWAKCWNVWKSIKLWQTSWWCRKCLTIVVLTPKLLLSPIYKTWTCGYLRQRISEESIKLIWLWPCNSPFPKLLRMQHSSLKKLWDYWTSFLFFDSLIRV